MGHPPAKGSGYNGCPCPPTISAVLSDTLPLSSDYLVFSVFSDPLKLQCFHDGRRSILLSVSYLVKGCPTVTFLSSTVTSFALRLDFARMSQLGQVGCHWAQNECLPYTLKSSWLTVNPLQSGFGCPQTTNPSGRQDSTAWKSPDQNQKNTFGGAQLNAATGI